MMDAGSLAELSSGEGLAEGPSSGGHVVGHDAAPIARGDLEGKALPIQVVVALPVLAPVPGHGLPPGAGPLHGNGVDVPGAADVGDEDEVEVGVTVDGEPYPFPSPAGHPVWNTATVRVSYCSFLLMAVKTN